MPSHGGLIIGLAGAIGSGKSTVAHALAARLDGAVVGFGDFVRHLAVSAGLNADRATLQRIGQQAVEHDPEIFLADCLAWMAPDPSKALIIEGVRHVAVDQALREWAQQNGLSYLLVLLVASIEARADRRCNGDVEALMHVQSHPAERETVEAFPTYADIVVDGAANVEHIVATIEANAPAAIRAQIRS